MLRVGLISPSKHHEAQSLSIIVYHISKRLLQACILRDILFMGLNVTVTLQCPELPLRNQHSYGSL